MAAIGYPHSSDLSGHTTGTGWFTTATSETTSWDNDPPYSFNHRFPKFFYFDGLRFKTKKESMAYSNMVKSREVSVDLSFFTPHKRHFPPPKRVKRILNLLSLKQTAYAKRKKFKEKIGLKH